MRVLISGGSGYIGSHTVAKLLAAGHKPRLLVRDPGRAARVLETVGVDSAQVDFTVGDIRDADAVERALAGCDATIHAAAAIAGSGAALVEANVTGTENIVGGSVRHGLDPVIHVSTVAVFVPPSAPVITPDAPLASPRTAYGRSKAQAERLVRRLQDEGAPITVLYPGGVIGPHQPNLDAMMQGLVSGLQQGWGVSSGGVALVDVRDVATALVAALSPDRGARRFLLGGHFLTWPEMVALCDELTGRPCKAISVPAWALRGIGSLLDLAKRVRHFDYPLSRDAADIMTTMVRTDDEPTLRALGIGLLPVRQSVEDSLRWLAAAGHLDHAAAGRLAPT
ncbi:NAD-dependent epimerase/dehydratase family protein [Streptosporangium sp. NPDC000396]|uniref:NAD-dependent epimerase/dehydratase family protein n=1 Tax=Streptosporangium sp. NPDC000396 TaxID=3366185 RepID=UPI0036BD6EC6